jgi:co-chaperonin GroES (HSP10)
MTEEKKKKQALNLHRLVPFLASYNNFILTEKLVETEEQTTEAGIIVPVDKDKAVHTFSRVVYVGWSCSKRLDPGDIVIAEKAFKTHLTSPRGHELQLVRETDICGYVKCEFLPEDLIVDDYLFIDDG